MKVRIKFSKLGPIKFIGHLDLMRTFQKVFRRADIDIAYSEGFNPHQLFSIAAPLSVGIESHGEYLDLKLNNDCELRPLLEVINNECPNGIKIIGGVKLDEKEPAAMAAVSLAKYTITQKEPVITTELINEYAKDEEILIQKKTKKGKLKTLDIKPGIKHFAIVNDKILMSTASGSVLNIKPMVVLESLCERFDLDYNPYNYSIVREEIYHGEVDYQPLSINKVDNGSEFIAL